MSDGGWFAIAAAVWFALLVAAGQGLAYAGHAGGKVHLFMFMMSGVAFMLSFVAVVVHFGSK